MPLHQRHALPGSRCGRSRSGRIRSGLIGGDLKRERSLCLNARMRGLSALRYGVTLSSEGGLDSTLPSDAGSRAAPAVVMPGAARPCRSPLRCDRTTRRRRGRQAPPTPRRSSPGASPGMARRPDPPDAGAARCRHGDLENLVGDHRGDTGDLSAVVNRAAMRRCWEYGVGAPGVPMFLAICVSMIPGSTMATRTLNALPSWARHSLSASSANLEAVYAAIGATATCPATEATLMMHPLRRCLIAGRTAWQHRITPSSWFP